MGTTNRIINTCALLVASAIIALGHTVAAEASTTVSVRDHGAIGDGSADDTRAVQRAMDVTAAAGGGRVYFPEGTYRVGGLFLSSAVELYGDGDAVLKSIDPLAAAIVYAKTAWTTGTIAHGSNGLRVANTRGTRVGAPVAIRGAGQHVSEQTTNDPYLYSKVASISGNNLTIENAAVSTVIDATVWLGITKAAIRGLVFDGNKGTTTKPSATVPIDLRMTGGSVIANNVVRDGLHGAIRLDLGSTGNLVENNELVDNGRPAQRMGAAIWLFRGARSNAVRGNEITGSTYLGIAVDDRTESASDWDGASNGNTISNNVIDIAGVDWNLGIYVGGSSSNRVENNTISRVQTGIIIEKSTQGTNGRDAKNNVVKGNTSRDHRTAITVSGSQNTFSYNKVSSSAVRAVDTGSRNSFTW